jgi:hypothetical protein
VQESHAQESFEYLLAKFNTKACAAKQAAAADLARQEAAAADAMETSASAAAAAAASSLPLSAPTTMALQLSAPMSMPFDAQLLSGSSANASGTSAAAEQLQMPCMQSPYTLCAPLGGYPAMQHMALHALGGLHGLGGLPGMHASGSPVMGAAAQLMAADMQAAVLMSCGYPAAGLLSHSALLHATGTPTDCVALMQPSLYGSPVGGRQLAAAAAAVGAASQSSGGVAAPTGSHREKTSGKLAAGATIAAPGSGSAKANKAADAAAVNDMSVVANDQEQRAQPKAKVVLNL